MSVETAQAVVGTTVAFSFILAGNAITQSFMSVPALLVDFPPAPALPLPPPPPPPPPSSAAPTPNDDAAHTSRARLLGRQWPLFWRVGNRFFRPISAFGVLGYGYGAWVAFSCSSSFPHLPSSSSSPSLSLGDWRYLAVASLCHLVTVVHSAVNMQPLNEKIEELARATEAPAAASAAAAAGDGDGVGRSRGHQGGDKGRDGGQEGADLRMAEEYARRWIRGNLVRLVTPVVAGSLALSQLLGA